MSGRPNPTFILFSDEEQVVNFLIKNKDNITEESDTILGYRGLIIHSDKEYFVKKGSVLEEVLQDIATVYIPDAKKYFGKK